MLEVDPNTPYCPRCRDFYYIRESGYTRVCPRCSCPRCERLLGVHPDLGGCTCTEPQTAEAPQPGVLEAPRESTR